MALNRHQEPRTEELMATYLILALKKCISEHGVYVKCWKGSMKLEKLPVCLYVDDLLITNNSEMMNEFEMSDLGLLSYFLGIEFEITKYERETDEELVGPTHYRKIFGCLRYLCNTRPDLSFGVGLISRFMQEPRQSHLLAAKRILRYVQGTIDFGVLFPKGEAEKELELIGYSDSDWCGDKSDRKNNAGGAPISWSSTKELVVALSSCEAEYIAASKTACQAVWLEALMKDLQVENLGKIKLLVDNKSAIDLARHPASHGRSKHIETRFHFLREQLLRRDEQLNGILLKPRRPRAVVLCPTRELSEQVFRVAKSISHHARFRCTMVSGGGRIRPQEDSLNNPIDMVVGTPGRVLQHIEEGNMVYGDIKYLVLDEADTMFDRGFGPDIRKFLGPLKNRASKPDALGFQTILVTATMTKAVQKLIDEEFQGILHLRTSTLHKKISSARHDFIKLSGSENKLEALLQVLEPSLAKGNRVMVFCNTLDSSRAVDHFLDENQISTVNYHGEVPAEQRVENLRKFKSDGDDCPTLVCTDLAARGLDLDVDHVVMFDFPLNSVSIISINIYWHTGSQSTSSFFPPFFLDINWLQLTKYSFSFLFQIDYLHRTGRTARMGAKGKVTSLVTKKDFDLASKIEEAMRKNESLDAITKESVRRDIARTQISEPKGKSKKLVQVSKFKGKSGSRASSRNNGSGMKSGKGSPVKSMKKGINVSKLVKSSSASSLRKASSENKQTSKMVSATKSTNSKLNVVGFRGKNSSSNNRE
ncbi:DEAD-box ATP-dependent RNA helicase 39, partial [Mucuna pruriens]